MLVEMDVVNVSLALRSEISTNEQWILLPTTANNFIMCREKFLVRHPLKQSVHLANYWQTLET